MMAQAVHSSVVLSLDNEVLRSLLVNSSVLVLKMLFMSNLTGLKRLKYKAFNNEEDAKPRHVKPQVNENVERVRRAHLNDVENIPLFFVIGSIYTLTNPTVYFAKSLFLAYTLARVGHTIVYAFAPIPQPARLLCWMVGYGITGYMAVVSLLNFI
ncbi:microsomal glutathione S-transferase 1 [Diabrotica virgifera virgifera]|uniref:Microsomal glutathione S-transferase 1 n=1 Tax=Diabrotica virgifera virgifera TaxID=50390 RepID=A0A6P7GMS0_DIAVI|nr:microsomal glutathione S-transferase 1 [Diabrotica virgifera virgifera]